MLVRGIPDPPLIQPQRTARQGDLSLYQLLKPEVLADPHPLYRRLREYEPVHWDPYLNSWIVTSYAEAVTALAKFKSPRTRSPELMEAMGVMKKAGIRPANLTGLPASFFPFILRLPTPLLRLVARTQLKIDPEARSSMWADLSKGRLTEVDYLNGEIVRLAQSGRRAQSWARWPPVAPTC